MQYIMTFGLCDKFDFHNYGLADVLSDLTGNVLMRQF